jgi:hypothetical protein
MNENNGTPHDERALNRLIRLAAKQHSQAFVRPGEDVIRAHFMGVATPAQEELFVQALRRSGEFQQEMRQVAADLKRLHEAEQSGELDAIDISHVPDLSAYIPRPISLWTRITGAARDLLLPRRDSRPSFPVLRYRVALVAATLLVVITVVMMNDVFVSRPEWTMAHASLDSDLVASEPVLRGDAPVDTTYSDDITAALRCMRRMLVITNVRTNELAPIPAVGRSTVPPGSRTLSIAISSPGMIADTTLLAVVPSDLDVREDSLTAWVLELATRNLYRQTLVDESDPLTLPPSLRGLLAVGVTYHTAEGFREAPCGVIRVRETQ